MKILKKLDYKVKKILESNRLKNFKSLNLRKNGVYGKERKNLLHLASKYSSTRLISYCIDTLKINLSSKTRSRNTALHYACKAGNLLGVKYIVTKASSILNHPNKSKQTALIISTRYKYEEISIYLVSCGANPLIQDKNGWNTGHWAAANGMLRLLKLLKHKGFDFSAETYKSETMLHLAAWSGDLDCFKYTLQFVSPTKASKKGSLAYYCKGNWTILMWAITKNLLKLNNLAQTLFEIVAPLDIFAQIDLEIKISDVIQYDRDDILIWMYQNHQILAESINNLLYSHFFIKKNCKNIMKSILRWNKIKSILFLYKYQSIQTLSVPLGILKELISFIV